MSEWFCDWFDSRYYHLLYEHRSQQEANEFIDELVKNLAVPAGSRILDLGCGSGRHAHALAQKNMAVTGIDLSPNNITEARKTTTGATFYCQDMRTPYPVTNQNLVLSLFTSFGYFENENDHLTVLKNIHACLGTNGNLLLDYLNAVPLTNMPAQQHSITREGVNFTIEKKSDQHHIYKTIQVHENNNTCTYSEKVALFTLQELTAMLTSAGFKIINTFGNYAFHPYNPNTSPRLIVLAQKL